MNDPTTIEILMQAKALIESWGYGDVSAKRFDAFTGSEGICLRPDQPQAIEAYMDGSRLAAYPFRVIVRRRGERDACAACCDIAERMEDADFSSVTGRYRCQGAYVQGDPTLIELEESNYHAWGCTIAVRVEED
ncbi:hypothetical protein AAY81_03945 [Denitrobacterium detoxificans]|uniref:Bacteriophage minor capsid protein n=1 Tax=Denitrobacterium detoxificans TaxID=79604 RepID=A0A172RXK7_9ACTN|nr:hypothetical protein [Denitrobacterium detoxificans]ANE22414.1 hypothetical protein AAY81_03945 [Denitrobacterium detoxificans]SEP00680.1 bacteriophage minor capsid protein [Denitrobacterium detoxificans]